MRKDFIAFAPRLSPQNGQLARGQAINPMKNGKKGRGRPAMSSADKKMRVTVSLRPKGNQAWAALAKSAKIAKGALAEWLARSPEAEHCRRLAIKEARFFVPRD